jgi:hypothetical protein
VQTNISDTAVQYGILPHGSPRWRSGHAADCRSAQLRFKSGPWLRVVAAIADGTHLDPFRTQQLSRLTWDVVLRYASPREPPSLLPPFKFLHRNEFCFYVFFYFKSVDAPAIVSLSANLRMSGCDLARAPAGAGPGQTGVIVLQLPYFNLFQKNIAPFRFSRFILVANGIISGRSWKF